MEFKDYFSWIASMSSVCVQLVGIQICVKFIRRGSTANVSCVPFTIQFVNACMWIRYGMLTKLPALVALSVVSVLLQSCYIACYYVYTLHKSSLYKQLILGSACLLTILIYMRYHLHDESTAIMQLGLIGCVMTILSYSAPLATLADVVRTKCTETVSFPLVFANFIVSLEWAFYGALIKNQHIVFPNFLGLLLTIMQLVLFICYPSTRSHSPLIDT